MALKDTINDDLREAMRAHQETRRDTLRLLVTAIRNAEIPPELRNADPTPQGAANAPQRIELTDEDVLNVVRKEVKQRRDSIEQFRKAGRQDLLDREEGELHVLLAYQPEQLTDVEVEALVRAVIAELGAQGARDQGKVMGRLASQLRGKADLGAVGELVQRLLAG